MSNNTAKVPSIIIGGDEEGRERRVGSEGVGRGGGGKGRTAVR